MTSRYLTIREAASGTCTWALVHPQYNAWVAPKNTKQHHGLLWISGKPGVGKSTLMKFLYNKRKMNDRGEESFTTSFFFNARGRPLERSVVGMYRSFLYYLLGKFKDLRYLLDDPHLPHDLDGDSLPQEALKEIFSRAIRSLGQRSFTCFVDALDECEDQEVDHMIHFFQQLTTDTSAQAIQFRVCFSHRHYPRINIGHGVKMTVENELGHRTDLSNYISSRLQVSDPRTFIRIRDKLLAKADGIFLWVVLVIDILNKALKRGEGNLQSKLDVIPTGLSELFRAIIERDYEHPADLLFSILWILFARRPLKPQEFHHALLAGRAIREPSSPDILIHGDSVSSETIENFIISSSKGLAQVTENRQSQVEFVHESVRDFLIRDGNFQHLWPDLSPSGKVDGHQMLAKCCITYLNHPSLLALFKRGPSLGNRRTVSVNLMDGSIERYFKDDERYPFLRYAAENFLYHANAISDITVRGMLMTTILANQYIQGWLEAEHYYRSQSREDLMDGLYGTTIPFNQSSDLLCYLVYNDLSELIRAWLICDPNVKFIVDGRRHPLTEALKLRDMDAVAALLGLPSSSNEEVKTMIDTLNPRCNSHGCYETLNMASRYGFNVIVDVLIKRGSLVDERDQKAKTSLMIASEYGQSDTADMLLKYGADINARDENGTTPLMLALKNGHRRVAMSLVERYARIDLKDKDGTSALVLAASKGFEDIVCCLIEKGAHVDKCGIRGSDPILAASEGEHHSTTKLLMDGTPGLAEDDDEDKTRKQWFWSWF
jgi:ankyrin repeat protein